MPVTFAYFELHGTLYGLNKCHSFTLVFYPFHLYSCFHPSVWNFSIVYIERDLCLLHYIVINSIIQNIGLRGIVLLWDEGEIVIYKQPDNLSKISNIWRGRPVRFIEIMWFTSSLTSVLLIIVVYMCPLRYVIFKWTIVSIYFFT